MQISSKQLSPEKNQQLIKHLAIALANQRSWQNMQSALTDFLTETELQVLAKRLAIAVMLQEGLSYQEIKSQLQVSTATISFVADHLSEPGFQHLISKVSADKWATQLLRRWQQKPSTV